LLNVCSSVLFQNSYIKLKLTFQLSLNTSHFDNYCRKVNESYILANVYINPTFGYTYS